MGLRYVSICPAIARAEKGINVQPGLRLPAGACAPASVLDGKLGLPARVNPAKSWSLDAGFNPTVASFFPLSRFLHKSLKDEEALAFNAYLRVA